jgi:hypothetical protein
MSTDLTRRQWQLLALAVAVGAAVRVGIATQSIGSNDADIWRLFAFYIVEHGVVQTYRDSPIFNHPPLMGLLSALSLEVAQLLSRRFIYVFKTLVLLSELGCAWLLWLSWRRDGQLQAAKMVALFSLNLISILISAYHGNTDCLFATLCLAAAYAFSREKWLWAGLALGAAINVKIVPLMLIPIFAGMLPSWRALQRFGAGLALCALPFLPVIWQAPEEFFRNVFAYNSIPFHWGIPLLIESTRQSLPWLSSWLSESYVPNARFAILGSMLLIGWLNRRHRLNIYQAGALGLSIFLVLAPGFGVQYLVWPLPLLFAAEQRTAVKYSLYGGLFAGLVYYLFWTGTRPWFSAFSSIMFPSPSPFLGMLAWVTLIGYSVSCFRKLLGAQVALAELPAVPAPQPAAASLVIAQSR